MYYRGEYELIIQQIKKRLDEGILDNTKREKLESILKDTQYLLENDMREYDAIKDFVDDYD